MSSNLFEDYQEQFFKMWKDNMDKMLKSDAYKEMIKNFPGAESYTKSMKSMVPNIEKYWKEMASYVPKMPEMDFTKMMEGNPVADYWKQFADKMPDFASFDYWKQFADKMPDFASFWKNPFEMMQNMTEMWKGFIPQFPTMNNWYDSFAKMMPNQDMFKDMFKNFPGFQIPSGFELPGFDAYAKVYDLWKILGDSSAVVKDYQKKYMDTTAEIIKGLFPAAVQPFVARPMDFVQMMVEYYKQFVAPFVTIDQDIMERVAKGDADAYVEFFKDYAAKYEEQLEKYFLVMNFGLNREATTDYMKFVNEGNKALIAMGELMAVINKTSKESFEQIADKVKKDLEAGKTITTFRDFYNVWYSVTEAAFEKLLATDAFSEVFCNFADRYAQYMIAQNKVMERMLSSLPIPTNTDMKSLYKTVYDLRKDVRDLKKAMAAEDKKEA